MKKRVNALLLALVLLLSLTGCGKKEEEQVVEETPPEETPVSPPVLKPEKEPDPVPDPEPEPYVPAGTNPLTGLPMEPEYETVRPVAVMFNNMQIALPQLGVAQADIIYEAPAEGGITRMMGVFQTMDGVGNLGSIRSTRPYYIELAMGHDAVLLHAGGSPDAYENIRSWGVNNIDGVWGGVRQEEVFWRDQQRKQQKGYEHSLLASGETVQKYLDEERFRTDHKDGYTYPQQFCDDATPVNGSAARRIEIDYTYYKTGVFTYDDKTGTYLADQYGAAYVDGNTGEQVRVVNLLILNTKVQEIAGDTEGRLRVRTTGEGDGLFCCGGRSIPIRWSRGERSDSFTYTLENGAPLVLEKGRSYVCLIDPADSPVKIS